ncbi:MAG: chemotaxis protein CheC [Candidatus Omnitrophica bacterium]|nr:chemotaxis protein CheC [Candidatus Omnitrophota bacterium]
MGFEEQKFSVSQMDLLKEIGTIGSATAATALADMVGSKVEIEVPEVSLIPLENLSKILETPDRLFFVLDMEIKGDVGGRIFLLLSPKDAQFLAGALLGRPADNLDCRDDMFRSALLEACNILGGAYVSALADMTSFTILTSTPSIAVDMVGAILDFIFIQIAQVSDEALFIKTDVKVRGLSLEGFFLLFPTTDSLQKIFDVLGVK